MKRYQQMFACVMAVLCFCTTLDAQSVAPVGRDATGLPGLNRVGVWYEDGKSFSVSGTAGYGFTEAITDDDGTHNRGVGRLGLALVPAEFLQLGLRIDGRLDSHTADEEGTDSGMVGEPWFIGRLGSQLSDSFALGGELGVWFPGREAPSIDFGATTVEAKLLPALVSDDSPVVVAGLAGFRLDRSAESAPDADRLRRGDRIALGVSDFNAVLVGLGIDYRLAQTEILAEGSADILLGADSFTESPLRASAGVRQHFSEALQLEAMLTGGLSSRPDIAPGSDLIPIEPLFQGTLGLRYIFDLDPQPATRTPIETRPEPEPEPEPEPKPEPKPKAVAAPVTGLVTDQEDKALAQVNLTLTTPSGQTVEAVTDNDGRYRFEDVPFGKVSLHAETADFQPADVQAEVSGDGSEVELPTLQLNPAVLHAQVQGLVRSFGGEPLQATVTIEPPGEEHTTGEDGRFAINVQPGTYTVTISAEGYESQKRTVLVPEKGVIVFNADLRKQR